MQPQLVPCEFVNLLGAPVALGPAKHAKAKVAKDPESSHKGWRVVGIPPGRMEVDRAEHFAAVALATRLAEKDKSVRIPKEWDEDEWRRGFKKAAIRSKPYVIRDAALTCKELAERSGWTSVDVVEIKKEVRTAWPP
jgi:ribosomal protein S11